MRFLEKDLEEIIYTTDRKFLKARGLNIKGKLLRQLRIGNYGIADLVSVNRPEYIVPNGEDGWHAGYVDVTIYELKQEKITKDTFLQAIKYAKGLDSWFEKKHRLSDEFSLNINFVLIGSSICLNDSFVYLTDFLIDRNGCNSLDLLTYEYKADGIYFRSHSGYKLINEGF